MKKTLMITKAFFDVKMTMAEVIKLLPIVPN